MKTLTFIYTIIVGVIWEIAYGLVIICLGSLIALAVGFLK